MKHLPLRRLLAIGILGFALTLVSATLEPAVLGHKILESVAPADHNTALGVITFAGLIVAIVAQPIVGALSDRTRSRWGRRLPYMLAGAGVTIVGLYLIVAATGFEWLLVVGVFLQLGVSTMQAPWQALIPDQVPEDQRGRASGLKAVMDIAAALAGRYVAGQIVGRYADWGTEAIAAAVSVPVVVLSIALAITARGAREAPSHPEVVTHRGLREVVKSLAAIDLRAHPAFAWWLANRFFFWCAFIALTTFLLFFAIDVLGLSPDEAQQYIGRVSVWLGAALLVILIPASWLADRIGRRPLVIASGLITALGTGLVLMTRDLNLIAGGAVVVGVGVGAYLTANWALVTDIVPRGAAAHYLGVANIATASGSALARLLGGSLIDSVNAATQSASLGYYTLFAIAAGFFAISAFAALPMSAPRLGAMPASPVEVID